MAEFEFRDGHGTHLLREYVRRRDTADPPRSPLKIAARTFRPLVGGDHSLTVRFEANRDERIFGMGQYQQELLDLKGCTLELAHRNTQASVPFALSSRGYGMLWNNPAIGRVTFASNITEWQAEATRQLDYWITAGDTPAAIVEAYAIATGKAPMMPDWATGLWQSKLRYRSQDELLTVAREHVARGLPLSVIAADFFHWSVQGDWQFDPTHWPDPAAMVSELRANGIELIVSVWPTVDRTAQRFPEMLQRGFLIRTERGTRTTKEFGGNTIYVDVTNPEARRYFWDAVKRTYWDQAGVRVFWLDESEPEFIKYEFDHYRFFLGPQLQIGNLYPMLFAKTFHDGMAEETDAPVMNLVRSAWAGSQRYGALVWSGDIDSTFDSLRCQLRAGLNMGLAGIPWWSSDVGGFHGGSADDPAFRELVTRWFQFATFCPILRMHGDREPRTGPSANQPADPIGTGGPNEVWSYGPETLAILTKYLGIRERLRPYIAEQMRAAHEHGIPLMRPLFFDFPADPLTWENDDLFMFGPDLLIAPILDEGVRQRRVYLPAGTTWRDARRDVELEGGQWIEAEAPISDIPVFLRGQAWLPIYEGAD